MTKRKPQITITEAERIMIEYTIETLKGMKTVGLASSSRAIESLQHLLDRSKRDE